PAGGGSSGPMAQARDKNASRSPRSMMPVSWARPSWAPRASAGRIRPLRRARSRSSRSHLVGDAVRSRQHVGEQVYGAHRVAAAAHRGGDIAVEREAAALLIAGLHDLAGQVGGEVDF